MSGLAEAIKLVEAINTVLDLVSRGAVAMERVIELQRKAAAEGRRISAEELAELHAEAGAAIERLRETIGGE